MKEETALSIIEDILFLIESHNQEYPQHINSCSFLRGRYTELREAILNDTVAKIELIKWNKWFAPRIVFDGINNKAILNKIEKLDTLLANQNST